MENLLRNGVDLQGMYNGKSLTGDAHFFEDVTTPAKVRQYLDSYQEADKLKGMKLLLAMLSKGKDIPEFFPDVVKNVVVKSIEVKKMVYIYLVHYADFDAACREIALLSINSFQKDMSGTNPLIRGLALRVMTSIRVHDIIQIQLLAVRKCATDSSPYVRKCAANAIPKVFSMDPEQIEHLKQLLDTLLKDSSTMVLGSTVSAFNEICPREYSLLHRNHRKLCHLLADMDEWTQISTLEVLTRYVRNQFTDPAPGVATAVRLQAKQRSTAAVQGRTTAAATGGGEPTSRRVVRKAFYSDEEDESDEETVQIPTSASYEPAKPELGSVFTGGEADSEGDLDPDHRLVLKSSLPLLKSRNSGVVLAVCTLHYYCGTQSAATTHLIGKALVRVLRNRREVQFVLLTAISTMARERPDMFRPFLSDFFVKSTDPTFNRVLKLDILTSLSYKENTQAILKELQIYLKDTNEKFVCAAVRMVGQIADADPAVSGACMEGVMHLLLCSKAPALASECVVVLRQLLQQNIKSTTSLKILRQLAKLLIIENGMEEPIARSSIVWLIGEFHKVMSDVAPDILRILASGFADEFTETKMQIMNLAIKLSLQLPEDESVQLLMTYVLEMARYDVNTDLRDRSRFMTAMMGLAPSTESEEGAAESAVDEDALAELNEHAPGIMLAPKLPPVTLLGAVDVEGIPNFTMGSLSSVVGHNVLGYEPLMAWLEVQPDPSIRDALRQTASDGSFDIEGSNNRGGRRGGGPGSGSDSEDNLRNFYNSSGGVAGGGAPRLSYSSSSSSSSASSRSSRSRVSSSGSGSEDDSDRSDENSNCSGRSSSSDTSSGSGSSSDDSSGGERRNARPHKKTSAGSNNHLPVPFVSAKPSPAPAARLVASSVSTVPASRSTGSCMEGLTAPTLAPQGSKGTVTMQGIRKVAPSKGKRDLLLTADTGSVLIDTGNHASSDDLVGLSATPQGGLEDFSAPATSSPFYDDMSAYDAPSLSGAQDSLLVPTLLAQPVTTMPPAPSLVTATASLGPGLNPGMVAPTAPASISTVALSSGYAGLMAPNNVGKPSAMMAHAPNAPSMHMPMAMSMIPPSGGGGLAGNQRMMMQQPLALTQHVQQAQAPGPSYGAPPSAGIGAIGSCEPCLQEGETLTAARVLLKPEMGGGLAVTIVFRNGVQAAAYSGAISAYIVLKNTRDQPIRRIRVSFPVELRRTNIPEVGALLPDQEVWLPVELVLAGYSGKQVKADIRSDKGAAVGLLVIHDWDLLLPLPMKSSDFEGLRSRLGGFGEICKSVSAATLNFSASSPVGDTEMQLIGRMNRALNMYLVQGAGVGELMFAASAKKGLTESRLLITVGTDRDEEVSVRINCEDPVLCNSLGDIFFKLLIPM